MEWQQGKPWTHPSIQRLSTPELCAKLAEAYRRYAEDEAEFGNDLQADAKDLLQLDYERIETLEAALAQRDAESVAS